MWGAEEEQPVESAGTRHQAPVQSHTSQQPVSFNNKWREMGPRLLKPKYDINLKAFFRLISLSSDVNLFVKGRFHLMSSLFSSFSFPHLKEEPRAPSCSQHVSDNLVAIHKQLHWYKWLKAMSEVKMSEKVSDFYLTFTQHHTDKNSDLFQLKRTVDFRFKVRNFEDSCPLAQRTTGRLFKYSTIMFVYCPVND